MRRDAAALDPRESSGGYGAAMGEVPDVVDALEQLIDDAGGVDALVEPRGYPHLGVAIVDAVFSLRAGYDSTVVPVLQRYCDGCGIGWDHRFDVQSGEHGVEALLAYLGPMSSSQRCELLNWQVAPGTRARKADVCVEIASALKGQGVERSTDLAREGRPSAEVEWAVRRIHGVGPAAWSYLLNLSRVEVSKPDTMICRWVGQASRRSAGQAEAGGRSVTQAAAAAAIEQATAVLAPSHPGLTVRKVDHLVWRAASGRPLTDR